ncbi:Protein DETOXIFICATION 27 [Orobanche minor]
MSNKSENEKEIRAPLLDYRSSHTIIAPTKIIDEIEDGCDDEGTLSLKVWTETKKLWRVVGPAIFSRIASYSMFVITQAFAGHLGDLELAGMSIASNVIVGFDFGLMAIVEKLGMASALETLCGQAYGAKKHYMLGVYLQRSWIVLFLCSLIMLPAFVFTTPILKLMGQPDDVAELAGVVALCFIPLHFSLAVQLPMQRFLQSQLKNSVIAWMNLVALLAHVLLSWLVVYRLRLGVVGTALTLNFSWWFVAVGLFLYTVCGGCPMTWTGFSGEAFSGLWEFLKLSASSGVMLWLGKLVLQDSYSDDWKSQECRNYSGCLVHMHEHQWLGDDDSSRFFCWNWDLLNLSRKEAMNKLCNEIALRIWRSIPDNMEIDMEE